MPIRKTKDGRLTWAPGQKPKIIMSWLIRAVSHHDVGLPGARMAALLADKFNDKSGGCWMKNEEMAKRTKASISAVKAGLQQLEDAGHIIRVDELRMGVMMRHIYAWPNEDGEEQAPRARRGGVPKGVDPKRRAAEKAAAAAATSLAAEPPTSSARLDAAAGSPSLEPAPVQDQHVVPNSKQNGDWDDAGSWTAAISGVNSRRADLRSRG